MTAHAAAARNAKPRKADVLGLGLGVARPASHTASSVLAVARLAAVVARRVSR